MRCIPATLTAYLVDEASDNDAFETLLVAIADLLQVLDDDDNLVPVLQALSTGVSPNARDAVTTGEELLLEGSALDETLDLMRDINDVDDRHVLKAILANLVYLPDDADAETPLETILDVIAEVNRAEPGAGTHLDAEDYRTVLNRTHDFLTSEDRGLERLFDVVQQRELPE